MGSFGLADVVLLLWLLRDMPECVDVWGPAFTLSLLAFPPSPLRRRSSWCVGGPAFTLSLLAFLPSPLRRRSSRVCRGSRLHSLTSPPHPPSPGALRGQAREASQEPPRPALGQEDGVLRRRPQHAPEGGLFCVGCVCCTHAVIQVRESMCRLPLHWRHGFR